MANFIIEWKKKDNISLDVELNRIEYYNKFVDNCLKNYFNNDYDELTHKLDWQVNDRMFSLQEYNRIKSNINVLNERLLNLALLDIEKTSGQTLGLSNINELEAYLSANLQGLGNIQFRNVVTSLTFCGDSLKLNLKS
ncbi:MAG: hypothetical protein R3Y05_01335 [bacterium]